MPYLKPKSFQKEKVIQELFLLEDSPYGLMMVKECSKKVMIKPLLRNFTPQKDIRLEVDLGLDSD